MKGGYSQDKTLSPLRAAPAPVTVDLPPKPAPLSSSVPIFAATSVLFFVSLYVGLPFLRHEGVSWFWTYNLTLALPMFALVLFALLAYRSEGRPFTRLAMRDRFRLQPMDFCTWLWTGSLSVFMYGGRFANFLSFGLAIVALSIEKRRDHKSCGIGAAALALFFFLCWSLRQTGPWLTGFPLHNEPLALREFLSQFRDHAFMGIPLHGTWWVAVATRWFYCSAILQVKSCGGVVTCYRAKSWRTEKRRGSSMESYGRLSICSSRRIYGIWLG